MLLGEAVSAWTGTIVCSAAWLWVGPVDGTEGRQRQNHAVGTLILAMGIGRHDARV